MDEKKINQLLSSAVKHGDIPVELTDSIVDGLLEHPPGQIADGTTERVRAKLEIRMQDAAIAQAGQQITDRSLPFGRFLETVREKAGLTRTQIARRLGNIDTDLQRLERGDVNPLTMAPHSFADVLVLFHLKLASATPMIVASIRVSDSKRTYRPAARSHGGILREARSDDIERALDAFAKKMLKSNNSQTDVPAEVAAYLARVRNELQKAGRTDLLE
jgi:transcriptional regulator with XRE-family HTH domain